MPLFNRSKRVTPSKKPTAKASKTRPPASNGAKTAPKANANGGAGKGAKGNSSAAKNIGRRSYADSSEDEEEESGAGHAEMLDRSLQDSHKTGIAAAEAKRRKAASAAAAAEVEGKAITGTPTAPKPVSFDGTAAAGGSTAAAANGTAASGSWKIRDGTGAPDAGSYGNVSGAPTPAEERSVDVRDAGAAPVAAVVARDARTSVGEGGAFVCPRCRAAFDTSSALSGHAISCAGTPPASAARQHAEGGAARFSDASQGSAASGAAPPRGRKVLSSGGGGGGMDRFGTALAVSRAERAQDERTAKTTDSGSVQSSVFGRRPYWEVQAEWKAKQDAEQAAIAAGKAPQGAKAVLKPLSSTVEKALADAKARREKAKLEKEQAERDAEIARRAKEAEEARQRAKEEAERRRREYEEQKRRDRERIQQERRDRAIAVKETRLMALAERESAIIERAYRDELERAERLRKFEEEDSSSDSDDEAAVARREKMRLAMERRNEAERKKKELQRLAAARQLAAAQAMAAHKPVPPTPSRVETLRTPAALKRGPPPSPLRTNGSGQTPATPLRTPAGAPGFSPSGKLLLVARDGSGRQLVSTGDKRAAASPASPPRRMWEAAPRHAAASGDAADAAPGTASAPAVVDTAGALAGEAAAGADASGTSDASDADAQRAVDKRRAAAQERARRRSGARRRSSAARRPSGARPRRRSSTAGPTTAIIAAGQGRVIVAGRRASNVGLGDAAGQAAADGAAGAQHMDGTPAPLIVKAESSDRTPVKKPVQQRRGSWVNVDAGAAVAGDVGVVMALPGEDAKTAANPKARRRSLVDTRMDANSAARASAVGGASFLPGSLAAAAAAAAAEFAAEQAKAAAAAEAGAAAATDDAAGGALAASVVVGESAAGGSARRAPPGAAPPGSGRAPPGAQGAVASARRAPPGAQSTASAESVAGSDAVGDESATDGSHGRPAAQEAPVVSDGPAGVEATAAAAKAKASGTGGLEAAEAQSQPHSASADGRREALDDAASPAAAAAATGDDDGSAGSAQPSPQGSGADEAATEMDAEEWGYDENGAYFEVYGGVRYYGDDTSWGGAEGSGEWVDGKYWVGNGYYDEDGVYYEDGVAYVPGEDGQYVAVVGGEDGGDGALTACATCVSAGPRMCVLSACASGHVQCLDAFLQADPNNVYSTDGARRTPGHLAAAYGQVECLAKLLEWGADMAMKDIDGRTPLFFACASNQFNCVAVLVDTGFDYVDVGDNRGDSPLHAAACKGYSECAELLLHTAANPDSRNALGHTPAHLAANRETLTALWQAGGNMSLIDAVGRTPLFCACATNRVDVAATLLEADEAGVTVDKADQRGDTPLHACACNGNFECVQLLLGYAAVPNVRNTGGYTPAGLAELNGHLECMELIQLYDTEHEPGKLPPRNPAEVPLSTSAPGSTSEGQSESESDSGEDDTVAGSVETSQAKSKWKTAATTATAFVRWTAHIDPDTGYYYYYNNETGETQWDAPPDYDLDADPGAAAAQAWAEAYWNGANAPRDTGDDAAATGWSANPETVAAMAAAGGAGDGAAASGGGGVAGAAWTHEDAAAAAPARIATEFLPPPGKPGGTVDETGMMVAEDRKMNKDYAHLAAEYVRTSRYLTVARDGTVLNKVKCCMCNKREVTDMIVPCDHTCVCRKCIVRHNIGPARRRGAPPPEKGKEPWQACPVCMARIEAVVPIEKATRIPRNYGPSGKLPEGFRLQMPANHPAMLGKFRHS